MALCANVNVAFVVVAVAVAAAAVAVVVVESRVIYTPGLFFPSLVEATMISMRK